MINMLLQTREIQAGPIILIGVIIAVVAIIVSMGNKVCDWCGTSYNSHRDKGSVSEDGLNFCCRRHQLEFEEKRAEVYHKQQIAGKGKIYTNIKDTTYRRRK